MSTTSYTKRQVFNRPALHPTVPTPIDLTLLASSGAIPLTFVDGVLTILIQADADERDGIADIQNLYRVDLTPIINANGSMLLRSLTTPVLGDGTDGAAPGPTPLDVPHNQDADTWMLQGGRARQDYAYQSPQIIDDQLLYTGTILNSPFFEFDV